MVDYEKVLEKADEALDTGDYLSAIKHYEEVLDKYPNCITAWNNKGLVYAKKGEYKKAIENFDKAIELNSENENALQNKFSASIFIFDFNAANEACDGLLKINPTDVVYINK